MLKAILIGDGAALGGSRVQCLTCKRVLLVRWERFENYAEVGVCECGDPLPILGVPYPFTKRAPQEAMAI